MIQLGIVVSVQDSRRYGIVKASFPHGTRTLYHIHYIDPNTGRLMECPDTRCHGEHTCPIHGSNCTEESMVPFTKADIEVYVQEGMIDPELLQG